MGRKQCIECRHAKKVNVRTMRVDCAKEGMEIDYRRNCGLFGA